MGMIDDIKKTYEVQKISNFYWKNILLTSTGRRQLTDAESLELDSGVQGLEMRRQQSLHTINKMAAKVGLVISKYLLLFLPDIASSR